MKICLISDTHNYHNILDLPDADIIIHSGDFTMRGTENEVKYFLDWYSNLSQYKYKIFIAGNHDFLFEKYSLIAKNLIPDNLIYLEDNEVVIDGIKIYGTPIQKIFNYWAFNRNTETLKKYYANIPNDTDILVTHTPPKYILDNIPSVGCEGCTILRDEIINRIQPIVSVFGHIHEGYGIEKINDITFINASSLNSEYIVSNKPILIEIINKTVKVCKDY